MRCPLIIDLETKYSFRDFQEPRQLGISVAGVYDYADASLCCFLENELNQLYPLLERASCIIGYNNNHFDLPVLKGYYPGDMTQFKTFDILEYIRKMLGRRFSLNDIVKATLNKQKSGHGLQAIQYYKDGRLDELKKYCLEDVSLTKELFEYGVKHKEIFYPHGIGKTSLNVHWGAYLENSQEKKDISLTLPF